VLTSSLIAQLAKALALLGRLEAAASDGGDAARRSASDAARAAVDAAYSRLIPCALAAAERAAGADREHAQEIRLRNVAAVAAALAPLGPASALTALMKTTQAAAAQALDAYVDMLLGRSFGTPLALLARIEALLATGMGAESVAFQAGLSRTDVRRVLKEALGSRRAEKGVQEAHARAAKHLGRAAGALRPPRGAAGTGVRRLAGPLGVRAARILQIRLNGKHDARCDRRYSAALVSCACVHGSTRRRADVSACLVARAPNPRLMALALRGARLSAPRTAAPLRALRCSPALPRRRLLAASRLTAMAAAAKRVLVPIANGSEEMEAVAIIDVLRRAGADVTVASVEATLLCKMSRGVLLQADAALADVAASSFDLVALPGGMPGAERLRDSAALSALLAAHASAGRPYAAMCAAPAVVLAPAGLLAGRAATAHPAFAEQLPASAKASTAARVVLDGPVLTSRGPGTALEFALALVELLYGKAKALEVAGPMVMHPPGGLGPLLPHEWRL